jgi:L-lactate utilization protein LutB
MRKLAMKAFGLGSSSPSLYKMGSKWAPAAMTPFTDCRCLSSSSCSGILTGHASVQAAHKEDAYGSSLYSSEKLAMKAFGLGSSSPSLYKMGSKWAPAAMTPFTA